MGEAPSDRDEEMAQLTDEQRVYVAAVVAGIEPAEEAGGEEDEEDEAADPDYDPDAEEAGQDAAEVEEEIEEDIPVAAVLEPPPVRREALAMLPPDDRRIVDDIRGGPARTSRKGAPIVTCDKHEREEQVASQIYGKSFVELAPEQRMRVGSIVGGEKTAEGCYTGTIHPRETEETAEAGYTMGSA
ncbi:hypothetical protein WJX72_008499 [[Myrmecia] bisecta]|uniref:Uncharacterized protein n=1 Tax=[Myrmecia] bisecta TaxID=41462 RepID=A0AAW1QSJ8_9CHLO